MRAIVEEAAHADGPEPSRSPRCTRRTWTSSAARSSGSSRCAAAGRGRGDRRTEAELADVLGRRQRVRVSRRGLRQHRREDLKPHRAHLCQAGLGLPDEIVLPRDAYAKTARPTSGTSTRLAELAGVDDPTRLAERSWSWRPRWRRSPGNGTASETPRRPTATRLPACQRTRGSTGSPGSRRCGPGECAAEIMVASPSRRRRGGPDGQTARWTSGRRGWPVAGDPPEYQLNDAIVDGGLRVLRHDASRNPGTAPRWKRAVGSSRAPWARRSAGFTSSGTSPRRRRSGWTSWSPTCATRSGARSTS